MQKWVLFVNIWLLMSCAALPVTYSNNYEEQKNSEGVYTVKFIGNGFTKPEAVEQALIRRCAELTLRDGYDWFTFYSKSRGDYVGTMSRPVPSYYGIIHLHKGLIGEDGYDPKKIISSPMPEGITN